MLANAPRDASAANELAFLLLYGESALDGGPGDPKIVEALAWAELAVAERPDVAAYHDTRARALLALGRPLADIANGFGDALRLDPNDIDALLGSALTRLRQADRLQRVVTADAQSPDTQPFDRLAADVETLRLEARANFNTAEPLVREALRDNTLAKHLEDEYHRLAAEFAAISR